MKVGIHVFSLAQQEELLSISGQCMLVHLPLHTHLTNGRYQENFTIKIVGKAIKT